jgi:cytochrome P450
MSYNDLAPVVTDSSVLRYPGPNLWSLRPAESSRSGRDNPLRFLQSLATRGDFVPFLLAGRPAVLLNRPEYVATVLAGDVQAFQKGAANARARHLLGNGLLTAEGDTHAERRKVIQPAFARKRLEECAGAIVRRAGEMCGRWRDGGVVDVAAALGELTFGIVGEAIVGACVDSEFEAVKAALGDASASIDPLVSLVAPLRRVRRAQRRLRSIVERIARRATGTANEGSLLALLNGHDSHFTGGTGLQPCPQFIDDLLTILLAGHDTITSALTWTLALVSAHPDVEGRLHDELGAVLSDRDAAPADLPHLPYARAVLAESLRLYPPAWVLARRASAAYRFDAGEVPAGTDVLVSQYLLHRDERFFERPQVFDPHRWLDGAGADRPRFAYFPFGAGPRACIGESFAWMEGVLLLATIARRWRLRTLGPFPEIDLRITMRPKGPQWAMVNGR